MLALHVATKAERMRHSEEGAHLHVIGDGVDGFVALLSGHVRAGRRTDEARQCVLERLLRRLELLSGLLVTGVVQLGARRGDLVLHADGGHLGVAQHRHLHALVARRLRHGLGRVRQLAHRGTHLA